MHVSVSKIIQKVDEFWRNFWRGERWDHLRVACIYTEWIMFFDILASRNLSLGKFNCQPAITVIMHLSALHCRMRTDEISGNRVCVLQAITSCLQYAPDRKGSDHRTPQPWRSNISMTDSCDAVNCDAVLLDGFSDCNGTRQGFAMYFNLAVTAFVPPPFPFGRICFVVLVMRKGGESSWSGPWHLGCKLEVFHVYSYTRTSCVFSLGLCFVCWFVHFDLFVCLHSFVFPWAVESSPLQFLALA